MAFSYQRRLADSLPRNVTHVGLGQIPNNATQRNTTQHNNKRPNI